MSSILVPISQLPDGVVPSIVALRALATSTVSDGAHVRVLGSGSANDGGQTTFIWSGASLLTDNGITVVNPVGTTGSWVRAANGPLSVVSLTASYSGMGENFILLSGSGNTQLIYTLPPAYTMAAQTVTVKSLSTGAFQIRATGTDLIFPATGAAAQFINLQQSGGTASPIGLSITLRPYAGVWYQ